MTTVEELDGVYRRAESRVDELRQAVRYAELCALHLGGEELLLAMVTASLAVLRGSMAQAEAERDKAADAVRVAWESSQA